MSWISFEMLHIYAGSNSFDEELKAGALNAKKWLGALKSVYEGTRFSKIVFVDDYSSEKNQKPERTGLIERINTAFETVKLSPDFIVFESDVAASCDTLRRDIFEPPEEGKGSLSYKNHIGRDNRDISETMKSNSRLMQYNVKRGLLETNRNDNDDNKVDITERRFRNDIAIGVNLQCRINKIWTCPAVAAWWQLIRLGALDNQGDDNIKGAPLGTWVQNQETPVPFVATRTITLLNPSYIEVEHAVRLLLSNLISLNRSIQKRIPPHDENDNITWLNRINYIFHD